MSNLDALCRSIGPDVKCPEDVFGLALDTTQLDAIFKKLVRVAHPDLVPPADKTRATEVFQRLTELKRQAEYKLKMGTYGDRTAATGPKATPAPTVIETKKQKYAVTDRIASGDLSEIYRASYMEGTEERIVALKVASHPGDNDLMEIETKFLTRLNAAKLKLDPAFLPFMRFVPPLIDSFALQDKGSKRRVNVLPDFGAYYSLVEVYREKGAIDFRDMVWMFKRTLEALGFIHRQGVIHGAITPDHVLVHPIDHGARIVDWCYAVEPGGHVKAISKAWRTLYAPEILEKKPVSTATDIYMAAKCALFQVGGDLETNKIPPKVPAEIQRFLHGCLLTTPARRPDDAWKVRDEFAELLQKLVGKPKYRKLEVPARGVGA